MVLLFALGDDVVDRAGCSLLSASITWTQHLTSAPPLEEALMSLCGEKHGRTRVWGVRTPGFRIGAQPPKVRA